MAHFSSRPPRINIAELWEAARRSTTDFPQRIASLDQWIRKTARSKGWSKKDLRIHDAAAGDGEVLAALQERRYRVTGSDGSPKMIQHSTRRPKIGAPIDLVQWQNLATYFGEREAPHLLLVPGASIPFDRGWDRNLRGVTGKAREGSILAALRNFKNTLIPGGVLLISTLPQTLMTEKAHRWQYRTSLFGKYPVTLAERIIHDPRNQTTRWQVKVRWDEPRWKPRIISRTAFYLPPESLQRLLRLAGFVNIKPVSIKGESFQYLSAEVLR